MTLTAVCESKLKLEYNLSEIFPVNNKLLFVIPPQFYLTKLKLEYLKFDFKCKKER